MILAPRDIWHSLETFLVVATVCRGGGGGCCHPFWVGPRDVAKYPTMHSPDLKPKNIPAPNVDGASTEEPWSTIQSVICLCLSRPTGGQMASSFPKTALTLSYLCIGPQNKLEAELLGQRESAFAMSMGTAPARVGQGRKGRSSYFFFFKLSGLIQD